MRETIGRLREQGQIAIGLGPMSKACVDAIYLYSNEHGQPIMLIASRRQVECAELGHGYVNNWATEGFGAYCKKMKEQFPNSKVFICRDHGGPWQGTGEDGLSLEDAMKRAVKSYEADVLAGFDLLHIDPSLCRDGDVSTRAVLENTAKLLRHCDRFAKEHGRAVQFEIGTEENVGAITTPESFGQLAGGIAALCGRENIEKPLFVVGQTQSLVKEMRQIGEFNAKNTSLLIRSAAQHGFLLKEHNGDYLTEYQFRQRLSAGVPAINIAPELGVLESQAFVGFCLRNGEDEKAERFLRLSRSSGKWKKWVLNPDYVSDYDKALIAGHYVFADPEFERICSGLDRQELTGEITKALFGRLDFYFGRYRENPSPNPL